MKKLNQQPIIEKICPDSNSGLNSYQVNERTLNGLTNTTNKQYSKSYLNIFIGNICTFFNLLGIIVFIAMLTIGSHAKLSDYFFVVFYVANISIGIFQEIRAKRCIDKLSILNIKTTKVIRDGQTLEISSSEIVRDDVLLLGIGNQIPTDSIILSGNVEVNESLLTGESLAVKKQPGDFLYAGSFITSGVCRAVADKVGKDNYVEKLSAKAKQYKKPNSEIMSSLKVIIKVIACIIIPLTALWMIKSMVILKKDYPSAILGTSTVVIGTIPAGMFLLTSVALAVGIIKLAKHKTLVQDLYSLEMLARVDTLCFDKTGTITDGNMTVSEVINLTDEQTNVKDVISSMINALCDTNQTATALKEYFGDNKIYNETATIPFNSARKFSAVSFENMGTFAYGAPEFLLPESEYSLYKEKIVHYVKSGLRVLVLAKTDGFIDEDRITGNIKAVSLIVISDNVRVDAIETVKWFIENDVNIKVISGDNPITVSEVSKRVGIIGADNYISLDGLTDQEVYDSANKYTVFGRVSPEQKAIILKALKDAGHVTAMTGDGVNDILALKEADCAISVASGSEAARNVSHLVLLDNNFCSMPKVVYEGRRVINNVQSSASLFLMKTLFTVFMGFLTLCLPYMQTYPYRLSNMIMFEVFIIGIPSFFLSFQPNDKRVEGRFISYVIKKSLPSALLMLLSVLAIEIHRLAIGTYSPEMYSTLGIYVLTFAGVINLFITCLPINGYRSLVFFSNLLIIIIFCVISMTGTVSGLLSLLPLAPLNEHLVHFALIFGITIIDIPLSFGLQKLFDKIKFERKKA